MIEQASRISLLFTFSAVDIYRNNYYCYYIALHGEVHRVWPIFAFHIEEFFGITWAPITMVSFRGFARFLSSIYFKCLSGRRYNASNGAMISGYGYGYCSASQSSPFSAYNRAFSVTIEIKTGVRGYKEAHSRTRYRFNGFE